MKRLIQRLFEATDSDSESRAIAAVAFLILMVIGALVGLVFLVAWWWPGGLAAAAYVIYRAVRHALSPEPKEPK